MAVTTTNIGFNECCNEASIKELASAAKNGSQESFNKLVNSFRPIIKNYIGRMIRDQHIAEDLVQEVFVKLHRNIERYDAGQSFKAWLFTIARRHVISYSRSNRSNVDEQAITEEIKDERVDPYKSICREETRENIWGIVRDIISVSQFDALWLRYGEDMSIEEISEHLNISKIHVKVLLFRARSRLSGSKALRTYLVPGNGGSL